MKRTLRSGLKVGLLALVLLCLLSVLVLSSCNSKEVADLAIVEDSVPGIAVIGSFNISQVQLLVTDAEGKEPYQITASSAMLTAESRTALTTEGKQNITLYYKGKTVIFEILVVAENTKTVKVEFLDAQGGRVAVKYAVQGTAVETPAYPVVSGQKFVGWVDVATGQTVDLANLGDAESVTVRAAYSSTVKHTITYYDHNGKVFATEEVAHGSVGQGVSFKSLTTTDPTIDWSTARWDVNVGTMSITQDIKVQLIVSYKTVKVSYRYVFESDPSNKLQISGLDDASVVVGTSFSTLESGVKSKLSSAGLTFKEWQTSITTINDNTTIVAVVYDRKFTVTLEFNGTSVSESVLSGKTFAIPAGLSTEMSGKEFKNEWIEKNSNGRTVYTKQFTVTKDITLVPKYYDKKAPVQLQFVFKSSPEVTYNIDEDSFVYGDVVTAEFINTKFAEAQENATGDFSNYEIVSVVYRNIDYTSENITLTEMTGTTTNVFTITALDPEADNDTFTFVVNSQGNGCIVNGIADSTVHSFYIPSQHDGKPVVELAANLFKGKDIAKIKIPDTVTKINAGVFAETTLHSNINIPAVAELGEGVFKDAVAYLEDGKEESERQQLTVTIGGTFTALPGNTFLGSKGIVAVSLPATVVKVTAVSDAEYDADTTTDVATINIDNVTEIGNYAFAGYTKLNSVGSLASVTKVGKKAFVGTALTEIILPQLTTLGKDAFADMKALTVISIATETANTSAIIFDLSDIKGCDSLRTITLGTGVTKLAMAQFDESALAAGTAVQLNSVTELNLSASLVDIVKDNTTSYVNILWTLPNLLAINVNEANTAWASDGGVLFMIRSDTGLKGYETATIAAMIFYPGGKGGDYTVPDTIKGHDVLVVNAGFQYVRMNTLVLNDKALNFFNSILESDGSENYHPQDGILDIGGLGLNNIVNMVINGSVLGADPAFTRSMKAILSDFNIAKNYYVTNAPDNFAQIVTANGWTNVFAAGADISAYDEASGLAYSVKDGKATVLYGARSLSEITVPATLGGVPVTAIAEDAFVNASLLDTLNINTTLEFIDGNMFEGSALTSLNIQGFTDEAVIKNFNQAAFLATPLGSSKNLVLLGGKLLAYNNNNSSAEATEIKAADLEGITAIPNGFFANTNVTKVTFPDSVLKIGVGAFSGSQITEVAFNKVSEIGNKAFSDCEALKSVTLTSVTVMGDEVFGGCSALTSVLIPNAVNGGKLPYATFTGCSALTDVNMPLVTELAVNSQKRSSAFAGCTSLKNIFDIIRPMLNIPAHAFSNTAVEMIDFSRTAVTSVGTCAFAACTELNTIIIDSEVQTIGNYAFYGCNNMISIKIIGNGGILGDNAQLGANIFPLQQAYSDQDSGIDIPAVGALDYTIYIAAGASSAKIQAYESFIKRTYPEVKFSLYPEYGIGERPFGMVSLIDTIYIDTMPQPQSVTGYIFDGWYTLVSGNVYTKVEFPYPVEESVTFYGKYINLEKGSLKDGDVTFNEETQEYILTSYSNVNDVTAYIPAEFNGPNGKHPIAVVNSGAFKDCTALTELTLPEGIKLIRKVGNDSFNSALKKIHIPQSLEEVNGNVFAGLSNLDIEFAAGSLLRLVSGCEHPYDAFSGSKWYNTEKAAALSGSSGHSGLIVAGRMAIEYIGTEAGQTTRETIEVPTDVYRLSSGLFENDTVIKKLIINDALSYIGAACFKGATNLEVVGYASGGNLNSQLIDVAIDAFDGTKWLRAQQSTVILGTILYKYNDYTGAEQLTIPAYITQISEKAFVQNITDGVYAGAELKQVTFDANSRLTTIGDEAFRACKLQEIVLPASVTDLGKNVFADCHDLKTADLSLVEIDTLPYGTFYRNSSLRELYLNESVQYLTVMTLVDCENLATIVAEGVISAKDKNGVENPDLYGMAATDIPEIVGLRDTAFYKYVKESDEVKCLVLGKMLVKYFPPYKPDPVPGSGINGDGEDKEIVVVPDGVEVIICNAFKGSAVNIVDIPASVKTIGKGAFEDSKVLTTVNLTVGLEQIREDAFKGCEKLTGILLPQGLKSIGNQAFLGCKELTEIVMPDSVANIGTNAFTGMTKLGSVRLSSGLRGFGSQVFAADPALYKISWGIDLDGFVELNGNIYEYVKQINPGTGVNYEAAMIEYIDALFGGMTQLRIYLNNSLYNYIAARTEEDTEEDAVKAYAWNVNASLGRTYSLFVEGNYPKITFDKDGYWMDDIVTEKLTELPVKSVKTNHTFMGWSETRDGEILVIDEEHPYYVYRDTMLYAVWFPNAVTEGYAKLDLLKQGDHYVITAVNTAEETLYIPATCNNLPITDFSLNTTIPTVKKLIFTDAANFNGVPGNIFRNFPSLTSVEFNAGNNAADFKLTDGVVYSADGKILIAYLETFVKNDNGETVKATKFTVPDGVETILTNAFVNSGLTEITVGKDVKSIGSAAFNNEVTLIKFAEGIEMIDVDRTAFENTKWYGVNTSDLSAPTNSRANWYEHNNGIGIVGHFFAAGNVLISYYEIAESNTLRIPNTLGGFDLTVIASNLNMSGSDYSFRTIVLPIGLKRINGDAFDKIDMGDVDYQGTDLTIIENGVFEGKEYYNDNRRGMLTLGKVLLRYSGSEPNPSIAEGIVAIASNAFKANTQIVELTLPSSLVTIGDYAFFGCTGLKAVVIPDNVTTIGKGAFGLCTGLGIAVGSRPGGVNFDARTSKLVSLGEAAFQGDGALTSMALPYRLETIDDRAFQNCSLLTSVTFDYVEGMDVVGYSRLTELGEAAFQNCRSLQNMTVPNGLTAIKAETFYGCTGLLNVEFRKGSQVNVIEERAFFGCVKLGSILNITNSDNGPVATKGLTTVEMPDLLIDIKESAFENCSGMLGISLGNGIARIGSNVFRGCIRLAKIDIHRDTEISLAEHALDRATDTLNPYYRLRIYVGDDPRGTTLANYKSWWAGTGYESCLYQRSQVPKVVYQRTVQSGSSGATTEYSSEVSAELVIDPSWVFANQEYNKNATYVQMQSIVSYDEQKNPVYTTIESDPRLEKRVASFEYQVQVRDLIAGTNYTLLVVDCDRMYISVTL